MERKQQGTVTDRTGQQVVQGQPHKPLKNERKPEEKQSIDMNPGEPAHPYEPFDEQQRAADRSRQPT